MEKETKLSSASMRTLFFDTLNTPQEQYRALKEIWTALDQRIQMYCMEFIMGTPGLNNDTIAEEWTDRQIFRLKCLQQLLRSEKKVWSLQQNDNDDFTTLTIFKEDSGYQIKWDTHGMIAGYPDNDDYIIINDFQDALDEIDKMKEHRKNNKRKREEKEEEESE